MRRYDGNAQLFTGVVNCFDGYAGPSGDRDGPLEFVCTEKKIHFLFHLNNLWLKG